MKRITIITLALLTLLFSSCSPSYFTMDVELRGASKSGIDLNKKSIAIVYLNNNENIDSTFNAALSEGFAKSLEKEYFGGQNVIDIYALEKEDGGNYSSKDSLVNLIVALEKDLIFFMDEPTISELELTESNSAILPYTRAMYIYDSYSPKDTVHSVNYASKLVLPMKTKDVDVIESAISSIPKSAELAGAQAAKKYHSEWTSGRFNLLYYEYPNAGKWYKASTAAYEYRWKDAMDIWISLLDTNNMLKKSSLEYNIALACYIQGNKELALEWLNLSDQHQKLSEGIKLRELLSSKSHLKLKQSNF